jgi:hypothetical protein
MRYQIVGRDEQSGEPVEPFTVEAEDEEDARNRAAEMGVRVEQVGAPEDVPPPAPAEGKPPPANVRPCPHCGGRQLVRGIQLGLTAETGQVGLKYRMAYVLMGTEPLHADLCQACGTILRFYVKNTERNWYQE